MKCTLFFGSALWLCSSLLPSQAGAHEYWDGKNCGTGKQNPVECKVPDWIKSTCCGPADAHHLTPDMVRGPFAKGEGPKPGMPNDYYLVDGYPYPVDAEKALPSQDGEYWIFYRDYGTSPTGGGGISGVYCFFVPFAG